jgi:hypothetical protein
LKLKRAELTTKIEELAKLQAEVREQAIPLGDRHLDVA